MRLSVIVPVYNVERYLARCLDSVTNQGLPCSDYEIIIVNDGSTDSSIAIAEEYQTKHENIKVIHQKNQGLSVARNTGIHNAIGEYLYFIDSDDYIETGVFKDLLELVVELNLDFLGFDVMRTSHSHYKSDVDFSEIRSHFANNFVLDGVSYISKYNFNNGAWWYIVKRNLLIINDLFFENGRMAEDGIFTTEVLLNCKRAAFLPIKIYRYFVNPNSITNKNNREHILKLIEDFKFAIVKFSTLISLAKEKNADDYAILRLKTRQESYVFFLFVRLLRANISVHHFKEVIHEMKLLNVYPIKNFIGDSYNSKKERLLTFIFNKKYIFYFLIQINHIFRFIGNK